MSKEARKELGFLLRQLQEGEKFSLPHSRPMPVIGSGCYEFLDSEAIVILEVGEKKTQKTSRETIEICQQRLKRYEEAKRQKKESDKDKR